MNRVPTVHRNGEMGMRPPARALYVYVLRSRLNPKRHYIGRTSDVLKRLAEHNAGESRHTTLWRPWHLVVDLLFSDPSMARAFGTYLKSGSGRAFTREHF